MANERELMAPVGRELAGMVLDAFNRHRLVGIGESHGLQDHHDALQLLLADPRLPEAVDDIVVEFGNARYQDTMDRFMAGRPVADTDLRAVWRNTTQSPRQTWDAPVYEQPAERQCTLRKCPQPIPQGILDVRKVPFDPPGRGQACWRPAGSG